MYFLPLLSLLFPVEKDTLVNFNIEEAVVVASPKEKLKLRQQPLSVNLFDASVLRKRGISSAKDLSALVPNVHMPEYGSHLTSACYIRGIGSRINTPAVGLYVDNVPYVDKSSYDFSFQGIDRVDVLRGPQGTLYGRNTMGGLIRVFTADPLTHKGTDLSAGWTSRTGGRRAALTTFLHPADQMGISVNAYYEGENGFYTNSATGGKQDGSDAAGGRLRWTWRPVNNVKFDWTASYEYTDEDACPYFYLGSAVDEEEKPERFEIAQNRPSAYRRHLFNTGLGVEHHLPRLIFTTITSYQHLNDRLFMDQDFTAKDIFSLEQRQYGHTFTEEFALKNVPNGKRWNWTTGAFGMYQHLRTTCPVIFHADGIDFLNNQLASVVPSFISLGFKDKKLAFDSRMETPTANLALFHQSVIDLPLKGLSLTLGLRLDYNHTKLRLQSGLGKEVPFHFGIDMGPTVQFDTDLYGKSDMDGESGKDSWQVLPKAALNYVLPQRLGNVYFSVAKGYRAGGYNIQAYSELSQSLLRRSMMMEVKDYSVETINSLPIPDDKKEIALEGMRLMMDYLIPDEPSLDQLYYKPEYTWSYEVGAHLNLMDKMLQMELSAFYMKTRDQQLARFAESGLGRINVNAGKSRSCGFEASLRTLLFKDRLNVSATYGYTNAEFTDYDLGTSPSTSEKVDYTGNRVPFVPEHNFSVSADYRQPLKNSILKAVSVGTDVRGAGSVVWNEANTFSQDFYANWTARIGMELAGNVRIEAWGKNLTASRYATFSFDSMSNRFAQYNQPRHFGVDVSWHF